MISMKDGSKDSPLEIGVLKQNGTSKYYNAHLLDKHSESNGVTAKNSKPDEEPCEQNCNRARDNPPCSFVNVLKTLAAYIAFFGGGMGNSILGTTILQLEKQTGSTTKEIASIFLWRASGSLMGNVLIASVFDLFPPEIILSLGCLGLVGANLGVPFCTHFIVLGLVIVYGGFSHGIIGAGCNSFVVKTWRLKSPPFLQALHFITSFGSCVTPLIVDLFVSHVADESTETFSNITTMHGNLSTGSEFDMNTDLIGHSTINQSMLDNVSLSIHNVSSDRPVLLYPYLITSLVMFLATVAFAMVFCMECICFRKPGLRKVDSFLQRHNEQTEPILHRPLLVVMFVISFIYGGMELTYGAWILTFCVKYLETSFQTAAFVTTAYWASLAGGRALSIPTTKLIQPQYLITFCFLLSFLNFVILTIWCRAHAMTIWMCTIVIGVSFAPVFGNLIAFSQQKLNISGKMTTIFCLIQYIGYMAMPALVGYLFGKYTPMFFLYIPVAGAGCITLLFIVVRYYAK